MNAHIIENGLVVNTIIVDSLDALPNLVEATEGGIGWTYADGVFTPPALEAAEARAGQIAAIEATFAKQVKQITAGYSEDEIKTWDKQVAEAEAYTANAAAPTPLLDALTGATGDAKADLVGKVISKANAYSAAVGEALGKKQKAIKDLGAAK